MLTKQKIFFRADAGANIGYGHFIRSLALADMLKSDFDCVMFTQTPTAYQIAEAANVCQLISLPADESRFDKFLEYLSGDEIVVLDNYFYTTEYQQQIKDKGCKLVCIDDMHDKHFVADVVINHGHVSIEEYDVADYTQVCTGPKYALLRGPFLQQQFVDRHPHSWVVTIGGLDEPNITTLAVKRLQDIGVKDIMAIVGDGFRYYDELRKTGVKVLSRLTAQQMAETFAQTENVLCCASTVCYEALSQGCKVYAGWYVDNQVEVYQNLSNAKCIVPIGNLLDLLSIDVQHISTINISFEKVRNNLCSIFYRLALRMVNYVDMTIEESRQVWETRNLPQIREWMRNKDRFSFESHCAFVESLRSAKDKLYYAFFIGSQLVASYDIIDLKYRTLVECGLFIHPTWQQRGLGYIIEDKMERIVKTMGIAAISADVYLDNEQSRKYFIRNDFDEISRDDEFIHFEKTL